jgi:transcription elongation GreA/GreB family factor
VTIDLAEKRTLYSQLCERVMQEYLTDLSAQKTTPEAATHEEARPENDKDTRALEQSYLARGQAARVKALKEDVDALSHLPVRSFDDSAQIALGAFVALEDKEGAATYYLLAPAGAGATLSCSLGEAKVVTQKSPLGQALLGNHVGEDVEIRTPAGLRVVTVAALS